MPGRSDTGLISGCIVGREVSKGTFRSLAFFGVGLVAFNVKSFCNHGSSRSFVTNACQPADQFSATGKSVTITSSPVAVEAGSRAPFGHVGAAMYRAIGSIAFANDCPSVDA